MSGPFGVILSISADPAVSQTRRLVLKESGYLVAIATNFVEVEQKCKENTIACVIIGTDIEPDVKRAIAQVIREACPTTPILEIIGISPEIEGASTVQSDEPEALVSAVDDLLNPLGHRYSEQLLRRAWTVKEISAKTLETAQEIRKRIEKLRSSSGLSSRLEKRKAANSEGEKAA